MNRPTGIIRTLPSMYADRNATAFKKMMAGYEDLAAGRIEAVYIALHQKPTKPVLHMYTLVDGKIICRTNIAGYEDGTGVKVECWDEVERETKWWAICTTPISFPPEPIYRRGFQGFRYTEDLW